MNRWSSLFFILIFIGLSTAEAGQLRSFESDACTLFANGTVAQPKLWEHCCFEHDLRYWFGGSAGDVDRADSELRACVKRVAGQGWANLIYNGVRTGHSSPVKSKYAWSWGWDPTRDMNSLSDDEIEYIKSELYRLPLDAKFRDEFIRKYLR